jgi:ABC-2 type transport system ATP-binding protein
VPSDGDAGSLRTLLNELHDAGADAGRVSIYTPDLDDVFFAFTGDREAVSR